LPVTAAIVEHAPQAVLDNWLGHRGLEPFEAAALSALFERVPERLLRVLELHFETPQPSESAQVLALLSALPAPRLPSVVAAAAGKNLARLPGPTLQATRKLLHHAVGTGGALAASAYPVLAELEEQLSGARRA
jgi:hypothetical protein